MKEEYTEELEDVADFAANGRRIPGFTMEGYKRIGEWVAYQIKGLSETD